MIGAVFFDVGETLVNEGRMWASLGAHAASSRTSSGPGSGAAIARGEPALAGLGPARRRAARPGSVGLEDAELYADAEPCLRRLRADGYFVGLAGNVGRGLGPVVEYFGLDVDWAASSAELGVEKPSRSSSSGWLEVAGRPSRRRSPTSATASTTTSSPPGRRDARRFTSAAGRGATSSAGKARRSRRSTSSRRCCRMPELRVGIGVDAHAF